jgi:hypothetical protein
MGGEKEREFKSLLNDCIAKYCQEKARKHAYH